MAEQERKTFKWGDQEYLLDDLLKLHAAQENNFYDFARNRGQYDDNALMGLRQAITNRINAVKSGEAFEGDGVLGTDKVDNTRIQTQKKGLFRKEKYVDQDNTEWAKYYLNKLVGGLKAHKKEEKTPDNIWNLDKHGFGAYLKSLGYTPQSIFEGYDKRDASNPEAKRGFTERDNHYFTNLQAWRNGLKDYDFTKDDNPHNDGLLSRVDAFLKDPNAYDRVQRGALLREIGAGDYADAYTSDRWDLTKSQSQLDAEAKAAEEKRKKEAQDKAWEDEKRRAYSIFTGLSDRRSGQMQHYMGKDRLFDLTDEDISSHMKQHNIATPEDEKKYWDNLDAQYAKNPYDASVAQLILPMRHRQGALKTIDAGEYGGWMYDPSTINKERQSAMAFNSGTGQYEEVFLGHIADEWNRMKNKYMIDNGYVDPVAAFAKEGGVLAYQTGGTMSSYDYIQEFKDTKNKERAAETGRSEKVQKARDRVVSNGDESFVSDQKTLDQPNAGFTTAEKVRLGSIAADIGSIFLDPISGTAVGLGSTLANFGADVMDDGFQWEDVKNLGINAGFDLLGAIPLFGDAVGTGSKITRNLVKWAPRVMAGLATYQGVSNFDGMMDSWSKFTSGDKDQKLTVQDWRNIAQSIGLVTGATRAIKNKVAQNQVKTKAKVDGVVGVNVRDKNTGEIKQLLVDGKTAEAIRSHKGDAKKIQQTLSELEGYKDKFGENGTWEINTKSGGWQKPWGKSENADGSKSWELRGFRKDGRADVNDIYDFSQVPQGYGVSAGYKIPGVSDKLNQWHQQAVGKLSKTPTQVDAKGAKTVAEVDAEVKALKDPVDAQIKAMQDAMTRRADAKSRINAQLTPEKKRLQDIQTRLRGVPDEATLNTNKTALEQNIATNDANITSRQQLIDQAQKNLDKLLNKKRVPKKKQKQHAAAIKSARGQLRGHKTTLQGYQATKQRYDADMSKLKAQLQDYADLTPVQANVNRLQGIQSRLGRGNHTNAYNKLQQMLADLQTNHSTVSGRQVNWDMAEILQKAGVQNAFKQGGSIDKNKINKFLNYAKG